MQEQHLYEYAVIRVVPKVEREEFLNVGIVVYCQKQQFLETRYYLNKKRLHVFSGTLDIEEVEQHLRAFELICKGSAEGGPIGKLDLSARFRWLTATRSTVVQISKVHSGFCTVAMETVEKLYAQLVL